MGVNNLSRVATRQRDSQESNSPSLHHQSDTFNYRATKLNELNAVNVRDIHTHVFMSHKNCHTNLQQVSEAVAWHLSLEAAFLAAKYDLTQRQSPAHKQFIASIDTMHSLTHHHVILSCSQTVYSFNRHNAQSYSPSRNTLCQSV